MKAERGFTLLEVIVATVILAVAIVGLMSGVAGAMRNAARLTAYDRVAQLARLRMNDLVVNPMLPRNSVITGDFDPAQTGGVNAGWRARATLFEKPPSAGPGTVALQRIELEIWWMSGRERRTFSLDAVRPFTLKPEDVPPGTP